MLQQIRQRLINHSQWSFSPNPYGSRRERYWKKERQMKTRRSVRNQNILWNSIKAETEQPKIISEPTINCFNCKHYPKQGRDTMTCKLFNVKVSGLSKKECFESRPVKLKTR